MQYPCTVDIQDTVSKRNSQGSREPKKHCMDQIQASQSPLSAFGHQYELSLVDPADDAALSLSSS